MKDGLPDDGLHCLLQDHLGFLWIGTRSGLVKYDGYTFKVYDVESDNKVSSNIINLLEDTDGDLWIGTRFGLAILLRDQNKFIFYLHDKNNPKSISHNWIRTIFQDQEENIWIGTKGGGLNYIDTNFLFNKNNIVFQTIAIDESIEGTDFVFDIHEDFNGTLWATTANGLFKLFKGKGQLIQPIKSKIRNKKNHFINIVQDSDDILWIGNIWNGLSKFKIKTNEFEFYTYNNLINKYFSDNSITSLFIDSNKKLWAGTRGGSNCGLFIFDRKTKGFSRYRYDPFDPNSISEDHGVVRSIIEDNVGNIWIVQNEGKLNKINPQKNIFKYYRDYSKTKNLIQFSRETRMFGSRSGKIWFATENGLFQYLPVDNSFEKVVIMGSNVDCSVSGKCWGISEDKNGNILTIDRKREKYLRYIPKENRVECFDKIIKLKGSYVYCVLEDNTGSMWFASRDVGLEYWNPKSNEMINLKYEEGNPNSIASNNIVRICEDSSKSIWIAIGDGNTLSKINKEDFNIERIYLTDAAGYAGYVCDLFVDSQNRLWVGTRSGGIFLFNTENNSYIRINKNHGLPTDKYVSGFSEDHNGNIYCATSDYLIKLNRNAVFQRSFSIANEDESLHTTRFFKQNKEIFVISDKGFYRFYADSLNSNMTPPNIVLTDIKLFDESLLVGGMSPLKSHINVAKDIVFEYYQNDITIQYAALHYINPKENKYKYILENYDDNWKEAGYRRDATYTNLSHGEYKFKVYGSNSDGVWATEPATLSITILPPWWLTRWAYLIYSAVFISILTYLYYLQKKRLRLKHEMEMKDFEAMKLKEVDQMKSKFLANISHEFRTPLTLIKGPIERLIGDEKVDDPKKIYKMIRRNSERLLHLINELLDLSKLESGHMKLSAQRADVVSFTKGVAMSFESLALKKEISITVNSSKDTIDLYFDKEKLQKILSNIISNAFKFTQQNGQIELDIREDLNEHKVIINISDNGMGILQEELPKIFDRFYQVESSKSDIVQGTGIGLALTKELVEMHQGSIKVSSIPGEGTSFILFFPLGHEHLKEDEIIYEDLSDNSRETYWADEITETSKDKKEAPVILVVEDNLDVQNFIQEALEKIYRLVKAYDGEEGYVKARQHMPDLIVSDIMMPKESGDKMCERLKTDQITSHIPIILLTAKASQEDKIHGLETGADDYLIKPFNEKELLIRIDNLIKQRQKLREKYLREAEIHPTEVAVTSVDKKFIEQIIKLTDENISKPEFSLERFANELAMSRTQLYRKFNSILGEKPTEFVRKYRIRRSAELMKQNFGNIAQIAYEVGFNNLSYFAKCFKKIYKLSPHVYYKNLHKRKSS